jgi:transcriptional regulator with XRE-family HTH domain
VTWIKVPVTEILFLVDFDAWLVRVGANIRTARWLAGLTQEEVQGITYRYFQDLEAGKRNPTLEVLHTLAQQFDCSVADLVNVKDVPMAKTPLYRRRVAAPRAGRKPRSHPRSR